MLLLSLPAVNLAQELVSAGDSKMCLGMSPMLVGPDYQLETSKSLQDFTGKYRLLFLVLFGSWTKNVDV